MAAGAFVGPVSLSSSKAASPLLITPPINSISVLPLLQSDSKSQKAISRSTRLFGMTHPIRFSAGNVSVPRMTVWASAAVSEVATVPEIKKVSSKETVASSELLDKVDTFLFDCDGVIWRGDEAISGVHDVIAFLRSKNKRLVFVTNNATKSRKQYLQKFLDLGLDVHEDEIFSSSFAAAAYLQSINFSKKVYVVGEVGIEKELELANIAHFGGAADADKKVVLSGRNLMEVDPDVGAVVVGFDRNINYYKIQYAVQCLREIPGCLFIATNQDAVTHLTAAQEWAGAGSMVGAIRSSSQVEPTTVGKPEPFMLDWMCNKFGITPSQICMVGDRLDTDMLFGLDGGLTTVLVLTGVTTERELFSEGNKIRPDYYADSVLALLPK